MSRTHAQQNIYVWAREIISIRLRFETPTSKLLAVSYYDSFVTGLLFGSGTIFEVVQFEILLKRCPI
jgi:hypothetical protein